MTLGGGLAADRRWTEGIAVGPLWRDVLMFAAAAVVYGAVSLPFSWWHTFRIEERFGFNRMTLGLWLADLAKGARGRGRPRAAAAGAGPVAHARRRHAVVAVGVGARGWRSSC